MSTPSSSFLRSYTSQHLPKISGAPLSSTYSSSWRPQLISKYPLRCERNESRSLATVKQETKSSLDFRARGPSRLIESRNNVPKSNERNLKLGNTLRILQERLPTLLQKPLPSELLSPKITLNLFPSTHPHLPSVTGRVAYSAALWTSPIAWGRLPLISNVRLEILSERMIKQARICSSIRHSRPEQLVVRWRTVSKSRGQTPGTFNYGSGGNDSVEKITDWLGGNSRDEDVGKDFTGIFIFEFDEEGRILSHTIEHAQEGGNWERGVGAKVVGLTDWLLGGMKRNERGEGAPCPAFCEGESERRHRPGSK